MRSSILARNRKMGESLVGLLAAVAIVMILMVVFLVGSKHGLFGLHQSQRKDGLGVTVPGAVRMDAKDSVCKSNLSQVRLSIQTEEAGDSDGTPPSSIADLKLPNEVTTCPIDHKPYVYDSKTGTVHCTHPGHERF